MKNLSLLIILVAALVLAAGCTRQPAPPAPVPQATPAETPVPLPTLTTTPVPAAPLPDTVKVSASSSATILVDSQGKTLYFYAKDVQGSGTSACTGGCATAWPAFSAGAVRVSPPLAAADFGSVSRADGSKQTSYRGRPLYYSSGDQRPGDTSGSGIGGVWTVANFAGTVAATPPATVPAPATTPCPICGG